MTLSWDRRSIRARLAIWYAGTGVVVLISGLMAALASGAWRPASRLEVLFLLLVAVPAAAGAFAIAGYVIAGKALAPLRAMAERARLLSARSLSERLPVGQPLDELGQLASVFNATLDRLEGSFGELKRFSADASHELRTPLTAIRAVGEVGLREESPARLRDVIGSMLEEVGRMNQLIDRLLLLAQADNDKLAVRLSAAPVRDVLLQVSDSLDVVAAEKGQRLETSGVQDVTAVMDPALLRLALMNLVQNAIRYSPEGKPIALRAASSGDCTLIEVVDQGSGIPEQHQARIFERFYRVDPSRSRTDGGAGLGLAIVKWAIDRMNGTIELSSEVGRGSTFSVRLQRPGGGAPNAAQPGTLGREAGAHPTVQPFADLREAALADNETLFARLQSGPDGLSWSDASYRLEQFGLNEVGGKHTPRWPLLLWHAARNPFNGVLLALGVVSLITHEQQAAMVMAVMVAASTGLRFWQERKSLIQADSLRKLVRNKGTVCRRDNEAAPHREPSTLDHSASDIFLEQLVPGDIVLLSAGDMVPGDLRLLESRDLFVSQSTLTGEAMPIEKLPNVPHYTPAGRADALELPNLLFMGSSVVSGTGKAIVLATARHTYLGGMAASLVGERPQTAFDLGVNKVTWLLIRFMLVMVPIVFFINGLTKGQWQDAFFFAIAVAVGLTPEMLPMIVNANLARGALAMSRQRAIVKRLSAIQNLGAMDILCTDKTGTLTQDRVVLIRHIDLHGRSSTRVLERAYLNSVFQTGLRNLIDRGIIGRAREMGLQELSASFWKADEIPFDFTRRRMSVVLRQSSGLNLLVCKGAVDEVLGICTHAEDGERELPLTPELRASLEQLRDQFNDDGLRVVAVGYKAIAASARPFGVDDEAGLIFCGFVTFLDPPKDTAAEAVRLMREHGVTVKILTGDNAAVTRRICREVGLAPEPMVAGAEIESLSEDALGEIAERASVFVQLSPLQKSRIVSALKARRHTVGFLGDGINDATALREADVGISVDSGVDIAKESADIILLEKSLLVLEQGVIEGRRTFGNIIKYIKMTTSSNFGNALSVLVASAVLPFLPMLAIQLLVQNLLYDLSLMSIPWDRMDEQFMQRPRQWEPRSLATFMLSIGPISSVFDITAFLVLWFVFSADTRPEQSLFQSGWFVVGLLTQTLIVHMIRTEKIPFIQSMAAPPVVILTLLVMSFGVWLPFSPLAPALKLQPLPLAYFWWLAGILLAYCVLTQLLKRFYIRRTGSWL